MWHFAKILALFYKKDHAIKHNLIPYKSCQFQVKRTALPMPTYKDMMMARIDHPNVLIDAEDNFKYLIADSDWEVDPIIACFNQGKHTPMYFTKASELEAHIKRCFGFKDKICMRKKIAKNDEGSKYVRKLKVLLSTEAPSC